MIASTQIKPENFAFIAVLVFKILSCNALFSRQNTGRILFKKIANFTGKLLQNYKYFECKIFRILFKHISDHLSVLIQFA